MPIKDLRSVIRGKKILITGHTGFKGAWLSLLLDELAGESKPRLFGFSLPKDPSRLAYEQIGSSSLFEKEWWGDIRDLHSESSLASVIPELKPDLIFHLAAQSLVLQSHRDPIETLSTNVLGTAQLFEGIRKLSAPVAVINVTSDKCYQNIEWQYGYREIDPLGGKDIYSASKACAELVTHAYRETFFTHSQIKNHGVRIASVRAGNVLGGGDFAENRLLPDIVRSLLQPSGTPSSLELRHPRATRPWQFVLDPLLGYTELALRLLRDGGSHPDRWCRAWNFGPIPDKPVTVEAVVALFLKHWQSLGGKTIPCHVHDNTVPESHSLNLCIDQALHLLSWRPKLGLDQTLHATAAWYYELSRVGLRSSPGTLAAFSRHQVREFLSDLPNSD